MTGVVHAHCSCRACLRDAITMCGLPVRDARRLIRRVPVAWCPVCADMLGLMLATDECPRVVA